MLCRQSNVACPAAGGSTRLTAGKIVITFYSEEELENLVHKIGKLEFSKED